MKVLVTGTGSLLLGGIASELVRRGDDVVCLQRRPSAFIGHQNAQEVLADISYAEAVVAAAHGCDAVIHGAARVGVVGSQKEFHDTNILGTENVLRAAERHNIARLVFVSTPSVAHTGDSLIGAPAGEAEIGRSRSYYAESKAIAERAVLNARNDHLAVVAIRPHLVWGPGDTQLVGRIVERAASGRLAVVGTGNALVDSTYIDNAVSAHIAALDALHIGSACDGKAYVVSNGEPRTVNELMRSMCESAGVAFEPRHLSLALGIRLGSLVERVWPLVRSSEPPVTRFIAEQLGTAHWFDQRSVHKDLKWTPSVTIDEGFQRLTQWFASH
ncbi:MAG: nucleoside-diphosphate sugar epimerase [Acidimicrobium sp.]|nr:MAG: nucleoside-diphosphate sugar epimerase [Acidimicrobium sp.]